MPVRQVVRLGRFRPWSLTEPVAATTAEGERMAKVDMLRFSHVDVEATSVTLVLPNREQLECFTPAESPFQLRVLADTPPEEFTGWVRDQGGWRLEPRWLVQVVRDPLGLAPGAQTPGTQAYLLPRIYVARHKSSAAVPV